MVGRSSSVAASQAIPSPEWLEADSQLIVAIADALAPYLRPKYRVAIEKRIYQMSGEESLLLGFPDVWWVVFPQ